MTSRPGEHPPPEDVDGLLDGDPDELLRAHVDSCAHCGRVLAQQRQVRELLAEHAATAPLPDSVAARWQQALRDEPAFGTAAVQVGHSGSRVGAELNDEPLDLTHWPPIPHEEAAATREQHAVPAAGAPVQTADNPVPPQRLRRLRMAVALAAGFTILVGAGAATWTTLNRSDVSSVAGASSLADDDPQADAVPPDTGAMAQAEASSPDSRRAGDSLEAVSPPRSTAGEGLVSPEVPAVAAEQFGGEEAVRDMVQAGELSWPGVSGADAVRERATACLRAVNQTGDVLATRPVGADRTGRQLIVTVDADIWWVTEVNAACPEGDPASHTSELSATP